MRILFAVTAAAGFALLSASNDAQAARWCSYDGGAKTRCGYSSQQQCRRAAGRHGECRPQVATRYEPRDPTMMPGQIYPNRPYWSSPYECFMDDGGGRFKPCNSATGGGGLN
jgi:hypothetical protein